MGRRTSHLFHPRPLRHTVYIYVSPLRLIYNNHDGKCRCKVHVNQIHVLKYQWWLLSWNCTFYRANLVGSEILYIYNVRDLINLYHSFTAYDGSFHSEKNKKNDTYPQNKIWDVFQVIRFSVYLFSNFIVYYSLFNVYFPC